MTEPLTIVDEMTDWAPTDAEAALDNVPRVVTRRTLSGKRIHEVVTPEHDDAAANLSGALRQVVSKAQIRTEAEAAENEAAQAPGAPVQVVAPEGAGDRRQRRAWERQQATAARKARQARTRAYIERERSIPATPKGAQA